jgi:hypothetical protein
MVLFDPSDGEMQQGSSATFTALLADASPFWDAIWLNYDLK